MAKNTLRRFKFFYHKIMALFMVWVLCCAHQTHAEDLSALLSEPLVGSWIFTGLVQAENGDRYGYFFQVERQGNEFHTQAALVEGQTNKLVFFHEEQEHISDTTNLNWHIGHSFLQYNNINDSWSFGVKTAEAQGFNFKVDMLQQNAQQQGRFILRKDVFLTALQTSRLNGHLQINNADEQKEQFVTGNNAWFGKIWFDNPQEAAHDVSTTFCRFNDDHGFYSASLKEKDAITASVTGWRDALGKPIKVSQFISIKPIANNECDLTLGIPKLHLTIKNSLTPSGQRPFTVAGFFQNESSGFCLVMNHLLASQKKQITTNAYASNASIKPIS